MAAQCKQCGGQLYYLPNSLKLRCTYCHSEEKIELETKKLVAHKYEEHQQQESTTDKPLLSIVQCKSCGAQFPTSNHSERCPYCTASIPPNPSDKQITYDALIPFKLNKNEAVERIIDWIKNVRFVPNSLKKEFSSLDNLKGIYVPYFLISTKTHLEYKASGGINTIFSKKIQWHKEKGEYTENFENLAFINSKTLPRFYKDKMSHLQQAGVIFAEPWGNEWEWSDVLPFHSAFLSGYISEIPAQKIQTILHENEEYIKQKIEENIEEKLIKKENYDVVIVDKMNFNHKEITYQQVLLPVWISAFRYRNKLFQVVVNGQTGKVVGTHPYSGIKIFFMWIFIIIYLMAIAYAVFSEDILIILLIIGLTGLAVILFPPKKSN